MLNEWSIWGFTAVIYPTGSLPMLLMALVSLAPQFLIAMFFGMNLVYPRQRPLLLEIQAGMLFNEVVNNAVKRLVQQPRPAHPFPYAHLGGYGMPSSHTQCVAFLAVACSIALYRYRRTASLSRQGIGRSAPRRPVQGSTSQRVLSTMDWLRIGGMIAGTALVGVSRVLGSHHTVEQVLAGAALGSGLAVVLSTPRVASRLVQPFAQRILLPIFHVLHSAVFP